jgi:hemolysin activation/secretion protein
MWTCVTLAGMMVIVMDLSFRTLSAQAQTFPLPPVIDPSQRSAEPPPITKEEPLKPEPFPLAPYPLPPLPGEREGAGPGLHVLVKEIRLTGNTVISAEELATVTAPYLNKELTTEDLEGLRLRLTLYYVNRGYITSGAILPDQPVKDGVITYQIIEGKLVKIDLDGNRWFRSSYLEKRIALGAGPPLNINALQERLQLLQQDSRLEQVNAELRQGVARGESELHVKIKEASPFKAWLEFNNFQTPVVGAERGLATVMHQNLTGNGDPFTFTYGRSSGVDPIIYTAYTIPLTSRDTTFTFEYRRNDFVVVASQFQALNISSHTEIFTATLRQPIYRTLNQEFAVAITGEKLQNQTFLLGQPTDLLIPGAQNGVANDTAIRFIQEYTYRTQASVVAARSRFSVGIDALGATINSDPQLASGRFFAWLGQLQGVRRFDQYWGIQTIGRFSTQLTNNHLFPLEEVPVGGRFSVRGYLENTLVRDNAFLGSLESRLPLWRRASGEDIVQFAQFLDYGRAYNNTVTDTAPSFLASAGLGILWNILPRDRAHFEVYWGVPLNHVPRPGGNLQDFGIHLQLVVQVL